MNDLLIQQGVHKALLRKVKKSKKLSDKAEEEIDKKVVIAIHLKLGFEVIHNILEAGVALSKGEVGDRPKPHPKISPHPKYF